jgi:hypothetical protein
MNSPTTLQWYMRESPESRSIVGTSKTFDRSPDTMIHEPASQTT